MPACFDDPPYIGEDVVGPRRGLSGQLDEDAAMAPRELIHAEAAGAAPRSQVSATTAAIASEALCTSGVSRSSPFDAAFFFSLPFFSSLPS